LIADDGVRPDPYLALNREESDTIAQKCESLISERGWGFWAAEIK
jgi:hypothetical protein